MSRTVLLCFSAFFLPFFVSGQSARIEEQRVEIPTYPFFDPDPVPVLADNPKIYPYFRFDGYSQTSQPAEWKVVRLENDQIQVLVLPQVGGKVWGARDKAAGQDFIYRNEVLKFRNIAMRGPWTSGGIEFNFGIIGHTPTTATPVDYLLENNPDGSVSCVVGALDLPSRTWWRVRIRLPKDQGSFTTEALWYNPTPLRQSYYNWMTGAAAARSDLEFFCPGNKYLEHGGTAHPWPADEQGRQISLYGMNDFGSHKSYHVVGEYNDFFGGYYRNAGFGFGHWAPYDEMPGQKLWLWSLSRSGGIWEDLLTDTNGQYIEFQAGRLFNQFFPGDSGNPITQAAFEPYAADRWREAWFPVRKTGGISDVSPAGLLHAAIEGDKISVSIQALQPSDDVLTILQGADTLACVRLELSPLQVFTREWGLKNREDIRVDMPAMDLHFRTGESAGTIDRPFVSPSNLQRSPAELKYREGLEKLKFRDFTGAQTAFESCLDLDMGHLGALGGLAELYLRKGRYDEGLALARRGLSIDTYDPEINYLAGNLYRAKGDLLNARECLGWAARSMSFRSAAYAQIAEISLREGRWQDADHFAAEALAFNRYNFPAYEALAVAARRQGNYEAARRWQDSLLTFDPLNHFARFERFLSTRDTAESAAFTALIRNELPYQTYLELAIGYCNKGQEADAIELLRHAPRQPLVDLWLCYLKRNRPDAESARLFQEVLAFSPAFVFPYRPETLPVLEWATQQSDSWKVRYYLALNLWGLNRREEALSWMETCGNLPDFAPFYLTRAELLRLQTGRDEPDDLEHALKIEPGDWRARRELTAFFMRKQDYQQAVASAAEGHRHYPGNYSLAMDYGRALNYAGQFDQSLTVLAGMQVLPFEQAYESRQLYEQAHWGAAIARMQQKKFNEAVVLLEENKKWPENLGVGRPYTPDERFTDFLLSRCYRALGQKEKAARQEEAVKNWSDQNPVQPSFHNIWPLLLPGDHDAWISRLKNAPEVTSPQVQWTLLATAKDQIGMDRLKARHPEIFNDPAFAIIVKAIDLAD